eukprot:321526-Chlamydomonas_euryale.AAC.2
MPPPHRDLWTTSRVAPGAWQSLSQKSWQWYSGACWSTTSRCAYRPSRQTTQAMGSCCMCKERSTRGAVHALQVASTLSVDWEWQVVAVWSSHILVWSNPRRVPQVQGKAHSPFLK